MSTPHEDFHEVWWIASDERSELRIAHFRKASDGTLIAIVSDETPKRRGPRVWNDIMHNEGWFKVEQIPIPTRKQLEGVQAKRWGGQTIISGG